MSKQILILAGDGIGPEVVAQGKAVLEIINQTFNLGLTFKEGLVGGCSIDATGEPLSSDTLNAAKQSAAILLGAVGGPKWDHLEPSLKPEKGLLKLRSGLELFANIRPAILYPELADASTLKPEIVAGLDLVIVRELTGDIYFGEPRGVRTLANGERQGYNTAVYAESEIRRIGKVAFETARKRNKKLCSVDKANVMEVTALWREVITELGRDYPDVELSHMLVDNAAMQLVRRPKQFDVMVTGNMFGDILSDEAAMLTGSIGMLPSASLDANNKGLYEPCHGSAPDIAGQDMANPLATILSVAMLCRYSLTHNEAADAIEVAVKRVLAKGYRTADIFNGATGTQKVSTREMGEAVIRELNK